MSNDELIKVQCDHTLSSQTLNFLGKDQIIEISKEKLAGEIGLEMYKNHLIDFDISEGEDYTSIHGETLVHKEPENSIKNVEENQLNNAGLDKILTTVALLSRYEYWSKQLWKKRPATKDKYGKIDTAEIYVAFATWRLTDMDIYSQPVGSCWGCNTSKKSTNEYLEFYRELFHDYWDWQCEQR